jgi:hypothetical protein
MKKSYGYVSSILNTSILNDYYISLNYTSDSSCNIK